MFILSLGQAEQYWGRMKQGATHITTQSPQGTIFGLHVDVEGLPPTRNID